MGLFAPWFLAGLAGVALPLYLHLLKSYKSPPKPVPSLMRRPVSVRSCRSGYYIAARMPCFSTGSELASKCTPEWVP